jgi:DNA invertase Pin-like site-specific DNA recombinase
MKARAPRQRTKWKLLEKPAPGVGRVIGQVRFSSLMQDKRSIAEQKENILENARVEGWSVIGWCEEPAQTAQYDELERRPEFMKLLTEDAGVNCSVIICDETSRWSRGDVGNQALRILRERTCWWQTADGVWDINKPLTDGGAIMWAITQSQNEDFLRKLSYHVKKGKKAKAREGYSNGNPMFGYRIPEIIYSAHAGPIAHDQRRRIVFEPNPTCFPALVQLGELLAEEPPLTFVQVAEEMNKRGLHFWSIQYGERPWSPQIIEGLLYRVYPREFRPGCGHGTILVPGGEIVEGLHNAAWPYELCERIDQNRTLLAGNRQARPRKGNIHTFAGMLFCAHCRNRLKIQPSRTTSKEAAKTYSYLYYRCITEYKYGTPCPGGYGWALIRSDLVEHQFGIVLEWLGAWTDQAIEQLQGLYLEHDTDDPDPMQDYDRKQAELARRKENISKQHELGYLTTEQLTQRMAAILREESQLPVPIQRRWSSPQDTADMIRSLGEQWRQASKPHQRVLRYQLASALLQRLYVDLAEQRVVGIQFRADLYLPARHMLEPRGWQEHEPGVLWNQQAPLPIRLRPVDLSPCLQAGDSWAEHSGPGMLARRQNAVTG